MFGITTRKVDTQASARFFQMSTTSLSKSVWEIIQIAETETPGLFTIWALIDQSYLYPIKLNVPRTFYINTSNGQLVSFYF